MLDDYVTGAEAATLLKLSVRTLNRWHRLKKGPLRIKVGRTVFYRRKSITDWLDRQEH